MLPRNPCISLQILSFTTFYYWRNGIKSNDTSSFHLTTIVIPNIWKRFEFFLLNFDQLNFFHIREWSVTENVITEIKTIKHLLLLLGIKFYLVQNTSNCHWLFSILTVMTFLHRIPNRISHFPEQSYCRPWGRGLSCKCCSEETRKKLDLQENRSYWFRLLMIFLSANCAGLKTAQSCAGQWQQSPVGRINQTTAHSEQKTSSQTCANSNSFYLKQRKASGSPTWSIDPKPENKLSSDSTNLF